jgi:Rieske Fe-S protein
MEERVEDEGRRSVLKFFPVVAVACVGGAFAYVAGRFLYPIAKSKPPPSFVCLESELPEDEPLSIKDPSGRNVLIMRDPDGGLMAIGTVCTHLGCAVYYRPEARVFECPCHQGFFDDSGEPISGPPQRRLDRYPTEVRDGKVFVQFA